MSFDGILKKGFVDMRVDEENIKLIYPDKSIETKKHNSFEKINKYIRGLADVEPTAKYFSFYLGDATYRCLHKKDKGGEALTIRKIDWSTPKFNDIIVDPKLREILLTLFIKNKGFVISGRTGMGKSTVINSLFDFFNENTKASIMMYNVEKDIDNICKTDYLSKIINKEYSGLEEMAKEKIHSTFTTIGRYILLTNGGNRETHKEIEHVYRNVIREKMMDDSSRRLMDGVIQYIVDKHEDIYQNKYINSFEASKKKFVMTAERPIEKVFKDKALTFYQHSIEKHLDNDPMEFVNQSLRDTPDLLFFSEVRTQADIDAYLSALTIGTTTITTGHSYDSIEMLLRLIDVTSKSINETLNIITNSFAGGVNISAHYFQSLKGTEHKPFMQYWDYLNFTLVGVASAFKKYYIDGNINKFSEMANGFWEKDGDLVYIPKKVTYWYGIHNIFSAIDDSTIRDKFIKEALEIAISNEYIIDGEGQKMYGIVYGGKKKTMLLSDLGHILPTFVEE